MKAFTGNHYEKTERYEKAGNLFRIMKKYLRKDAAIPNLILTRVERDEALEWEDYYQEFDKNFKELHESIPKMTAIFLNCQVNPNVTVLTSGESLKLISSIRSPCFMLAV
jgi:hypothetical protein